MTDVEVKDLVSEIKIWHATHVVGAHVAAWERSREQTAATILAALTANRMVADDGGLDDADRANVCYAVQLADALRAALAGGK